MNEQNYVIDKSRTHLHIPSKSEENCLHKLTQSLFVFNANVVIVAIYKNRELQDVCMSAIN